MTFKNDDFDRLASLLDLAVNTARDTDTRFSSIQQTLTYISKYDKGKLEDQAKKLEETLMVAYKDLCQSQVLVEAFSLALNELLIEETKR